MENRAENKMGVMPVGKLLVSMSVPMMIVMLVQAFYNVVDSFFVARIGQDALNAVSLAFPLQNLTMSVALGTCVGVNALLSRSLGERNFENANRSAGNGLTLAAISYVIAASIMLIIVKPFYMAQTDIPGIVNQGLTYVRICMGCSFGMFIGVMCDRLLQSTGKTVPAMITQGTGAVTNIILDPLLIFGIGPFPEMGIAGAAWATVIGQIFGAIVSVTINLKVNKEITFAKKYFKLDRNIVKHIYSVGVPSMIMSSIGSVMIFGLNQILLTFTDAATAVFGVYFKLQSFFFMPVFGLNGGMVPIVAYNYGARKRDRIIQTQKIATVIAFCIMLAGIAVMELLPKQLLEVFAASQEMIDIGVPAFRTIAISFVFAGICITAGSTFQALGHGFMSMMVSIVRQLIMLLPVAFLLSLTGNINMVWWAFPIAEIGSMGMTMFFLRKLIKEVINPLALPIEEK